MQSILLAGNDIEDDCDIRQSISKSFAERLLIRKTFNYKIH